MVGLGESSFSVELEGEPILKPPNEVPHASQAFLILKSKQFEFLSALLCCTPQI